MYKYVLLIKKNCDECVAVQDPSVRLSGSDLPALNIQRGRDHELGTYADYRAECGLSALPTSYFSPPPPELSMEAWARLRKAYPLSPLDVELFPGGMSETPLPGGLVGPTFGCIIGRQFRALKQGDRYFFTHRNVARPVRLCPSDLATVRRRTMFDVLCDNTHMGELPRNPFKLVADTKGIVVIITCLPIQKSASRNRMTTRG